MRTIVVDPDRPDLDALAPAVEALRAGGLVAFPTETVYGLGALALDATAALRIFEAKGRPADDPLIVHVRPHWDLGALFAEIDDVMRELIATHWPGPLTIVARKQSSVPDVVTSGRDTVAVRAPNHPIAVALLDLVGAPIAAPSANRFSYVSPTTAAHVAADLGGVIDVLVDGGPTSVGIESTIVAVEGGKVTLLRPGSVQIGGAEAGDHAPRSAAPGRQDVHYSPDTRTVAMESGGRVSAAGRAGILIGYDDSLPPPQGWRFLSLGGREDLDGVARCLYTVLRQADRSGPEVIVVEFTGLPGVGEAIDDRIRRAAGGQTSI
ncbi:MAG TPA: L-threonylcarbamoyladenylate synthase [Acidimicrobiia bacterium]|nr:L-threonylcarbamoyladenylate synthase [Acidimicrobiia bacterium]